MPRPAQRADDVLQDVFARRCRAHILICNDLLMQMRDYLFSRLPDALPAHAHRVPDARCGSVRAER